MPYPHGQSLYDRLADGLRREGRKAAALTFLLAVLGVLWGRMAMRHGDLPTPASAAVAGRLSAGADPVAKGTETAQAFKSWLDAPLAPINRNLFVVNLAHFPQENRTSGDQGAVQEGFWGELAKSVSAKADLTKERQILLENLQQQANQLRLQTTLMGARPRAVVNGELVAEGGVLASGEGEARTTFRVLKIEARRIIIEREGIRLEVPMK